jgi:hypothetical protein
LRAELSEVEIGTSTVTDVHGLPETLLGVVSVEDDAIEDDGDALEDDFDQTAH